ncbi:photosynthetic complex putative assembly protein PuhB [Oceanibium sediminis]|uniref:photosynthetic complex putative assembly protein PuhB n=1 Tax=Oceanibium sediminis TaxID=2026339 RepID=UPI000DD4DC54|nr:photosynthetic complex putative assembly protein PuhB [Oceanibium sediminis]
MAHDDFAVEPIHGLEKKLPEDERILWQGRPGTLDLAVASMGLRGVLIYFGILATWRGLALGLDGGAMAGLGAVLWYVLAGAAAAGVILLLARVLARTTVYTITSARVVMRIGAALTVNLNLPYKWIASADMAEAKNGSGSIHLTLKGDTRISYLVLWPHVRPWHIRVPQPSLRAIPNVRDVAGILGRAAEARVGEITHEAAQDYAPVAAE